MNIGKVQIKDKKTIEEIEIKDLRPSSHPESDSSFYDDLQQHIDRAIKQNGIRDYNKGIYNHILKEQKNRKKVGFLEHLLILIGQVKGVIKYRLKHGKSTFNRYENYHYESLDLLKSEGLFKIQNQIFRAIKGSARLELIHSVSELCKDIDLPKVLEAGCGSGLNMYMLGCLSDNMEIHGFEYTNARLASCIVNLWHSRYKNNLFLADICNLNLEDNSYDVVFTNHVFEQLGQKNAEAALKEIWRVCKKGIVVCEPTIHGANIFEKWRMRTLEYCEDLISIAKTFPDAEIITYKEDNIRYYPNTSYHLIVKKS
ncbi:MAG: class I SAM-dependent methyltransferase [Bacteroidetes bacterium]|nr:MAG: class I SAM-dependent methyltransferase [Bacteroidota bacterium]